MLERALFREDSTLFGYKNHELCDDASNKLLIKQNKKIVGIFQKKILNLLFFFQNKTIPLTKHSSVFNGGIIGSGKRKIRLNNNLSESIVAGNVCELISTIKSCCLLPEEVENKYCDVSLESVTLVSLLLVQFVSPDVMYNGLPWPDEEFAKVTIERDLFIRRLFANTPVLWDLLNFIAVYRPALCYCSVLLRALTATLIHQWKSTGEQSDLNQGLMDTTVKVIDVMALGQLLPPPLSGIRNVLPKLQCFEVSCG